MAKRILNSLIVFLSVAFILNLLYHGLLFTYYELLGVDATWYFNGVYAPTIQTDIKWNIRLINILCFIEPILMLSLCIASTALLYFQGRRKPWRRIILIWTSILSASWFCSGFLIAIFFENLSIGTLYLWHKIDSEVVHFMFAIFMLPPLVFLGKFHSKQFMKLCASRYWLKSRIRRTRYVIYVGLIPMLLGTLIYLSFIFPIDQINRVGTYTHGLRVGTSIIAVGAAVFFSHTMKKISVSRYPGIQSIHWPYFIAVVSFLISIYVIWYSGIAI